VPRYLADTSIWGWAFGGRRPDIAERLAERLERDEVVTTEPVILEALHRARNGAQYEEFYSTLFEPLHRVPLTSEAATRSLAVQRGLASAHHGSHLRPAADFLIAAVAEIAADDVVLWFFDSDLAVICKHTGQAFEAEASAAPGR
jgi:predicted nucleic acid-binding protein